MTLKCVLDCQLQNVTLTDYHNYTQLMDELDDLIETYPNLSRLYSLGRTLEDRELAVIQISQGVHEVRPC